MASAATTTTINYQQQCVLCCVVLYICTDNRVLRHHNIGCGEVFRLHYII